MHSIERPVILDGRLADPARTDEAVVTANFVKTHGYGVGDTVTLRLFTPEQVDTGVSGVRVATPPRPSGPTLPVRIVGVVRSPWHSDAVGEPGRLFPSPGLFTQYLPNMLGVDGEGEPLNALVRLRDGQAGLEAFRAELARITGEPVPDVASRADAAAHLRQVTGFEAACLLAFGLVALLAALILVGQSLARYTTATGADVNVLRGPGVTRGQATLCAAGGPLLAAAVGTTLGIGAAIAASRWMPFGAAATLEPAPGVHADWLVLGTGWVLTPALVLAISASAAWVSIAQAGRRAVAPRSVMGHAAARAGLPVPVVIGTRLALEPGRGTSAVPVRPALLGAVTGVLGVLASFTFSAGVADAAAHPVRFGQFHQVTVGLGHSGQDDVPAKPVVAAFSADPDVAAVVDTRFAVAGSGRNSVLTFSYNPAGDPAPTVLTKGRSPSAVEEVVLAPTTARRLGVGVGATVPFTGNAGAVALTVVGLGFVPQTPFADYANGAWVTTAGYERLFAGFFANHIGYLTLRPGADPRVVTPRLMHAMESVGARYLFLDVAQVPKQLAELQGVRVLPVVLGGFLALLAVGAVGHALAMAVRRRRREMAVLRALGMTGWQARGAVFIQASVLAGIGLLFGIPLGMALGRTLWRVVADSTPLHYVPPAAFWALALIIPLALVIANLLAAPLGQRAAQLRISEILRAE